MLEVGIEAPDFCLLDENREEVCLKSFRDKWIVLYFYPKDQTPGCTKEACDFSLMNNSFQDMNAVVLGVSADSPESHQNFKKNHSLKITLLSDEDLKIIKIYQAFNSSILGKLMPVKRVTYLISPDGKIAHFWSKVKVVGHSQDVQNKIKELKNKRV